MIHVRKVIYNTNGFVAGQYLGTFDGDMVEAYEHFSQKWLHENTDPKTGDLYETIKANQVDMLEEFTCSDLDHFFIGLPNVPSYEVIDTEQYTGYGCHFDKYGFEQMFTAEGDFVPYKNSLVSSNK